MDWANIKHFTKGEFFGQDDLLEWDIISSLDQLRSKLEEPIYISPAQGAIARFSGSINSQHYVGKTLATKWRKSTAIDVFIEGIPLLNFSYLVHAKLFSGIGVYLDTNGVDGKPWVMFHLDQRATHTKANPLVWICTKTIEPNTQLTINDYHYPQSNGVHWSLLNRKIFFQERVLD